MPAQPETLQDRGETGDGYIEEEGPYATSGATEGLVSERVTKGVERMASRKRLTSRDLTVLLLHEQSRSISSMKKGVEEIAAELRELRREVVPPLNQGRDISKIRSRVERIEAKVS